MLAATKTNFLAILLKVMLLLLFLLDQFSAPAQLPHKKANAMLQQIMQQEHIPGLAYAVVKDGKVLHLGTLGKAHLGFDVPVNRETVFQLASVSKVYCAMLLGKLFDQGLLQPQQTLGTLLPQAPAAWKDISIRQLAAHQSGIKMADFTKAADSRNAFELAAKMDMDYTPGTKEAYVSSDYWVLQYVIETVTGMRYFDALEKYVLRPLKLRHTFVNNPKVGTFTDLDVIPAQAQEYHWAKQDSTLRINQMWFGATGYSAGGIYSSIEDMAVLAAAFDAPGFVSENTLNLIKNPLPLANGTPGHFGLGLIVQKDYQGHKIVEHSGGPALADFVRFENEKLTFIVLTNNRGVYPYLAKSLATLFIDDLKKPTVPQGWE
jgi:CubicO group peptidase (beta-lactamase class C family)